MLTVHHLQVSQSERIVWLCEELGLTYDLKLHQRAPVYAPQSIKDLHPLGVAPIIQDDSNSNNSSEPLTLGESAACAEYIIHKHGGGRLALGPAHPDYAAYLYWFHFANGSVQPTIGRLMMLEQAGVSGDNSIAQGTRAKLAGQLAYMDAHLGGGREKENVWLAGEEFTAADVMAVFSLTTMRAFYSLDLSPYPNILAWLRRCARREGYRRMRERADPQLEDNMLDGPPPPNWLAKVSKM